MSSTPELIEKVDQVIEFGMATPEANRKAVSDALLPLQNYHAEFPFIRLTDNQQLTDSDGNGRPDGWIVGSNISTTLLDTVSFSKAWSERSALEKEIMTACGAEGLSYWNYMEFNVWRFSWDLTQDQLDNGGGANFLLLKGIYGVTSLSYRCLSKIESGEITNAGCFKGITADISLTGESVIPVSRYNAGASTPLSLQGSIVFALPAAVAGIHPDDRWGYFGETYK